MGNSDKDSVMPELRNQRFNSNSELLEESIITVPESPNLDDADEPDFDNNIADKVELARQYLNTTSPSPTATVAAVKLLIKFDLFILIKLI